MKILVLNGPNLNLLGIREEDIYGNETLQDLEHKLKEIADEVNAEISFFDFVATAFWPEINVSSSTAWSMIFLSATAAPTPLLITIFLSFGTCIMLTNPCASITLLVMVCLYYFFNLGM